MVDDPVVSEVASAGQVGDDTSYSGGSLGDPFPVTIETAMRSIRALFAVSVLSFTLTGIAAQGGQQDLREQLRQQQLMERFRAESEQRRREDQMMFPRSTAPKGVSTPFHLGFRAGLQQLFPRYEGLPTYPKNVPGYGGYPAAGKGPLGFRAGAPGTRPIEKDQWPSWITSGVGVKDMKAKPTQAVLVRLTDRVWLRPVGERAFVPLAYYDRFRFVATGGRVEVRGKGEFQLALHDGGGMRSQGPCSLEVTGLNADAADLRLRTVDKVWLTARLRPLRVQLPDGTQLEFTAGLVRIDRKIDHIRVTNAGSSPIRYVGPYGSGEISGPRFINIWLAASESLAFGEALQVDGRITHSKAGKAITVRGGKGGRVVWSGASFALDTGSTLRLESLKPVRRKP
jgi:hypothetical protein